MVNSCSIANGNKSIAETRALSIALKTFNRVNITNVRLQQDNGNIKQLKNGSTNDDVYYFYKITASFFETEYSI